MIMNNTGYAILPGVLSAGECDAFISQYDDESLYRKKVIMERHQYGKGEYKYFSYPLPQLIQQLRETGLPQTGTYCKRLDAGVEHCQPFPGNFR